MNIQSISASLSRPPLASDDTVSLPLPFVLTDGHVCVELRWLDEAEFALANERAGIASGSAWEWLPLSDAQELFGARFPELGSRP